MSELTKCERCGVELMLMPIDEGPHWMEPAGVTTDGTMDVWMTHTPKSCSARKAEVERRIEAAMMPGTNARLLSGGVYGQDDQPSRVRVEDV